MPRNGSGVYSPPAGNPVITGTTISSTVQNNTVTDLAAALTGSLASDGQTTPTANLTMGGFKLLALAAGTLDTDAVNLTQVNALIASAIAGVQSFPSGCRMIFQQTSAPTGWTKDVSTNDAGLRIVSGSVGSGGAVGFTTVFGVGRATDPHTLDIGEIPAHSHVSVDSASFVTNSGVAGTFAFGADFGFGTPSGSTANEGGGGSHSHTISNLDLKYLDCIVASKN